jgi:DNA-directed RNA polymerase specialized sigma24 family protein
VSALRRTDEGALDARWDLLARRARRVVLDDAEWAGFWAGIAPEIERWAASPGFMGRLAADEDHRREVVVQTWEKLQERDFAKLRAWLERQEDDGSDGRRLRAWLRRVVKNIAIDHQRTLPEFIRRRAPAPREGPPPSTPAVSHDYWHSIVSITSGVAVWHDPAEGRAEAQRMLDFLDQEVSPRRLRAVELARGGRPAGEIARALGLRDAGEAERAVARAEDRLKFRRALELWSHGCSDDEIARALDLEGAAAAERMIKAAKELLRRSFRA